MFVNIRLVCGIKLSTLALWLLISTGHAQILMSAGSYTQNFDNLGSVNANWTNNATLPGWYAAKGNGDATNFLASSGSSTTGGIYSFGVAGISNSADRALGSIGASSINYAYGIRLKNDTSAAQTNVVISYIGEEWRSGTATTPQALTFAYQIGVGPLTNAYSGTWTTVSALSFVSPNLSAASLPLDGNASTNRQFFNSIALTGVSVPVGQELFLRWLDVDDTGFDNGLAIDDFAASFSSASPSPPFITTQPISQSVTQGANVTLTIVAGGTAPLSYQWQLDATDLDGAMNSTLVLTNVSFTDAGDYTVTVTNLLGATNSQIATLTVVPPPAPPVPGFSLLTYNTKGFGTTDWSTNAPQVKAIGRQLMYLQPDIVTLQEIPYTNRWQMANWVLAFLPGYYVATNSATDGLLSSAILSRFPITRQKSWLHSADLDPYGYITNDFTRDLYEAQIAVPGFVQPLHVFTTHLKSGTSVSEDAVKRAAEASCISNFLVTGFLTTNGLHPYVLTGDLNEDIAHPATGSQQPIQRLTNGTGLRLTTPLNPFSGGEQTFSIQATLNRRYDYILPNGLLFSNTISSQVFRTDLLPVPPPPLLATDDETASDHLPVLMNFANPYDKPFRLLSVNRSNSTVTLSWEAVPGQNYRVENSSNLTQWTVLATNLLATNQFFLYRANLPEIALHFRVYRYP